MHVLITGASSFVGRHATAALSRAGLKTTGTYRSSGAAVEAARRGAPQAEFVRLDIGEAAGFASLPRAVDAILHVAGVSVSPLTTVDEMLACNVAGTRNLLRYANAAGVKRIIYTSTLSVHGDVCEAEVNENTPIRAPDVYGASKYLAERMFAAEASRLPCVAIRLPGVLGEGAHRAWIPTIVERLRRNEALTFYNAEAAFNNAVHVEDLSSLFLGLLRGSWSGFHAFPVGASGQLSIRNVVESLKAAMHSASEIREDTAARGPFSISSDYAISHFGYRPMDIGAMLTRYAMESAS